MFDVFHVTCMHLFIADWRTDNTLHKTFSWPSFFVAIKSQKEFNEIWAAHFQKSNYRPWRDEAPIAPNTQFFSFPFGFPYFFFMLNSLTEIVDWQKGVWRWMLPRKWCLKTGWERFMIAIFPASKPWKPKGFINVFYRKGAARKIATKVGN